MCNDVKNQEFIFLKKWSVKEPFHRKCYRHHYGGPLRPCWNSRFLSNFSCFFSCSARFFKFSFIFLIYISYILFLYFIFLFLFHNLFFFFCPFHFFSLFFLFRFFYPSTLFAISFVFLFFISFSFLIISRASGPRGFQKEICAEFPHVAHWGQTMFVTSLLRRFW